MYSIVQTNHRLQLSVIAFQYCHSPYLTHIGLSKIFKINGSCHFFCSKHLSHTFTNESIHISSPHFKEISLTTELYRRTRINLGYFFL